MSQFTLTRLVNHRAVVAGRDQFGIQGTTTIDTAEWDRLIQHKQFENAEAEFEAAVKAHFAPLTEAAEKLQRVLEASDNDPLSFVVVSEAVEGQQAQSETIVRLSRDSQILRALEEGNTDRLVWVNEDLEILALNTNGTSPVDTSDNDFDPYADEVVDNPMVSDD